MNEKRYHVLVTGAIYLLRIAMIMIAVMIPVVCTIDDSILNRLISKVLESPSTYYVFELTYCEIILGYLLSMFLNFREKKIFGQENGRYLRIIGKLIILKDFLIIPVGMITMMNVSLNFNVFAWTVGYIFILLGRVFSNPMNYGSIAANSKAVGE